MGLASGVSSVVQDAPKILAEVEVVIDDEDIRGGA
jgi:hypothetical protein